MGVVSGRDRLRRVLLVLGVIVTVFGMLHHVDHVVRGNHSGWPFQDAMTPFTFGLLVYALLLPGIYVNLRGRVAAGWWVFTAAALALVTFVHFLGGGEREAPIRSGTSTPCTVARWRGLRRSSCWRGCSPGYRRS